MANNSVYNVGRWEAGRKYLKNNIAFDATTLPIGANIPKNIRYYYSLKDNNLGNALPAYSDENWGGIVAVNGKKVPEFLWTSSYNASISHSPKVDRLAFGNGYEQRIPNGLFSTPINFSATFEMRNEAEAAAIIHFLRARKGIESFTMRNLPPIYSDTPGGRKKLFVCPSFDSSLVFFDNYTIKATFAETNH